ncbi:multiple epidermal growth factor-like domains protein 11 [Dreissena polymorpha]|uniref:EGF-like domain-containing protein n=1 Tax=Dreissena polymorpha TaxID=45954 RepID=A0A9D4LAQ7_DREPO|nr:multiple epidermal growth factor-like domains protein 11 [Dreissena polymorpha]KAH3855125.1 hypothetical protein DPMN_097686 [Dreissena polymorpha]
MERTGLLICIGLLGYFHGISAAALGAACSVDGDCTVPATTDTKCQDSVCRLLVTKSCTSNTDKCVANAECGTGSLCVCKTGYAASAANLCLASLGTTCAANADCDTTTVTGTLCDTYRSAPVCAIGAAATCTANTDKCVYGATCSTTCTCGTGYTATTNMCLASLGTACQATTGCATTVAGTVCDVSASTAICAIGAGSSCTGQTTKCVSGATCSTVGTLCSCNTGYKRLFDNTCYLCSGTAGVVASIALIFTLLGTAVF